jgi:hypothetical protein
MPSLRPLLPPTAALLVTLATLPAAATPRAEAAAAAAQPRGEAAMAAGGFVDTVGVNVDPGAAGLGTALRAAGVRHVRAAAAPDPADPAWAGLRALAGAGLLVDLVVPAEADATAVAGAATLGRGLAGLEATGDPGRLAAAVRARPNLRRVPLLGPVGAVDHRTARLDLAGRCPGCVTAPGPDRRLQVTEATLGAGVPEGVAARYLPRLLLAQADTAARTYLGALAEDQPGPSPLLRADGSPTRALRTLANLLALLADPRPARPPGRLAYRLAGDTDGLRRLLLQKADGQFWLALWVEKPSWDPATRRVLARPAQPVRLSLAHPVAAARAFDPALGTAAERHFAGPTRAIDLEVADRVLLVELVPAPSRPAAARPAATAATARPAARPPRPPAPAIGGDRPGRAAPRPPATPDGPAATTEAAARRAREPLALTGSAAPSLLVASALLLAVGTTALAASRRRWHHHR